MCRHLAIVIHNFIKGRGGTKDSALSIVIESDDLQLKLDVDIGLLDNNFRHLSIDATDFLRLWFTQPQITQRALHHPSPYVGHCEELD
jgi:hypothetical protein